MKNKTLNLKDYLNNSNTISAYTILYLAQDHKEHCTEDCNISLSSLTNTVEYLLGRKLKQNEYEILM